MRNTALAILLLFAVGLTTTSCNSNKKRTIIKVTAQEGAELLKTDGAQIVDVRDRNEYQSGHLPQAINIPLNDEDFDNLITQVDPDKPVLLYCSTGGQSAQCSKILEGRGFKKIYDLDGGITEWKKSNMKIVLTTAPN